MRRVLFVLMLAIRGKGAGGYAILYGMKQTAAIHQLETKHPYELRLERNLLTLAKLLEEEWLDEGFESGVIELCQRLENELVKLKNAQDVKRRALERLKAFQRDIRL